MSNKLTANMIKEGDILLNNKDGRYYVCISNFVESILFIRETDFNCGVSYNHTLFNTQANELYTLTEYKANLPKLYASQWYQHNKDESGVLVSMGDIVAFTDATFKSFPWLKVFMEDNKLPNNEFVVTMMRGINHTRGAFYLQLESYDAKLNGSSNNRIVSGKFIPGWWGPKNVKVLR